MLATIRHLTFDCHDPARLAAFWGALTGYRLRPDDEILPDDTEVLLVDRRGLGPGLLFIQVPEPKTVKNRVHLDVQPVERRDVTFERVVELGGTLVDDRRRPDGTGWIVVADPEGNELCIERSAAERGEPGPVSLPRREFDSEAIRLGDEHEQLVPVLEWYRAGVVAKASGAAADVATTSPLRSGVTIAGLVNHLALVEDDWFDHRFAGNPEREPWASAPWDDDRDWEFHVANEQPLAEVIARYEEACDRSRRAIEGQGLDALAASPRTDHPFNLRFVIVHMIEETARHLGHLDILRELLDGTTGE